MAERRDKKRELARFAGEAEKSRQETIELDSFFSFLFFFFSRCHRRFFPKVTLMKPASRNKKNVKDAKEEEEKDVNKNSAEKNRTEQK